MPNIHKFTPYTAKNLSEQGYSTRKIGRMIGASASAVSKALRKLRAGPTAPKNFGPKTKFEDFKLTLQASLRAKPRQSLPELAAQLAGIGCNVSPMTVANWLHKLGFRMTRTLPSKRLTLAAKQERVAFAHKYRHVRHHNWVFTDEKIFSTTGPPKGAWVEAGADRPADEHPITPKSVQIWMGISWQGKTSLHVFPRRETNDGEGYAGMLDNYIRDDPIFTTPHSLYLLHDKASIHTSSAAKELLALHDLTVVMNPTASPELNPIEHIWAIMEHRLPVPRPQTYDELRDAVVDAAATITTEEIRNCISHLTVVKEKLIAKNGNRLVGE